MHSVILICSVLLSLVVEEEAQILDIETFISLQLQRHSSVDSCRLKRIVFLDDHNQLSPIVKSLSLQKFSLKFFVVT